MRVVDAGMPQFSMHSIREVMGTQDLVYGVRLVKGLFTHFESVDRALVRD